MRDKARALLVYDQEEPVAGVKSFLHGQGIETMRVRSCAEIETALNCLEPPSLIFTDTVLADGTWAEVEAFAGRVRPSIPVIVVSRFMDIPLYMAVLESGAADFIIPPFRHADLAHVVKGALLAGERSASFAPGAPPRTMPEVSQYAQNHAGSGMRAFHAQAGR
jgi:DNA-binding NtrC family response regulator